MPGASKNYESRVVLLKAETTEGVDAGPGVAADALRVLNFVPQFMDAEQKVRKLDKAYFGADPVTMSAFKRGAKFNMEIHGGGAANIVPPWMRVLQICGFAAPGTTSTQAGIGPATSGLGSGTLYAYLDDLLLKSLSTRGSVSFTIEDDDYPSFEFSLLGIPPVSLADQVVPGVPAISGYIDPVLASTENTTFQWGGYAAPLRRWTMSDNATLALRSLINPVDRILYSARSWSGQIVIEVGDLSVKNYFANVRPGTTQVGTVVHGTTPGNIVTITCLKLQITGNVELSEEQGKTMATFPVTALAGAGNDEISFVTT